MSEQERDKIVEASWMRFRDHQSKWFKAPPGASVTRNLFCEIIRNAITQATETQQLEKSLVLKHNEVNQLRKLLAAASHGLKSYQFGNVGPDLAESLANKIDEALNEHTPGSPPV